MKNNFPHTDELMKSGISEGTFPSAELLISDSGNEIFKKNYGTCTESTVFDVASLTKPIVTATLAMKAIDEGLLRLDDKLAEFYPDRDHLRDISIRDLLQHSAGFPSWHPYYREIPTDEVASINGRKYILEAVLRESLIYNTGSKTLYDDLGYILLGDILERIFTSPLASVTPEYLFKPFGMKRSFFRPVKKTPWSGEDFEPAYIVDEKELKDIKFAPTEDCPWRGEVVFGEVHDQNCYAMGGIAGHAGLFSDASDINMFVSTLLASLKREGGYIEKRIVKEFINFDLLTDEHTFLLGWDTPSRRSSQAGQKFSKQTIGHLGYTGCSLWIDIERDIWVILLTNRIHPTSLNNRIKRFRPRLHDTIFRELKM